jgi:hypothetical protein
MSRDYLEECPCGSGKGASAVFGLPNSDVDPLINTRVRCARAIPVLCM